MSGYEDPKPEQPRRRPDLSTFFSTLELVDTSGDRQPQNAHSLPLPRDISAAFRNLANAFEMMRGGEQAQEQHVGGTHDELLERLVQSLIESAEHPPTEVQGVSDEFIEQLERVPKKSLKKDMSCPICANPFLEDPHPLVVRLPCHKDHLFDLECIQPWLKLNPTCPLDRQTLIKKKAPVTPTDDEGDEYDDITRSELISLGTVDVTFIFESSPTTVVKESTPRGRLEREAVTIDPPPRGQDVRAPIDGVKTKRCQEWTMEFLRRLVDQKLVQAEAVNRAHAQRDPPTHGIFGAGRAAPQQGPARQAVAGGNSMTAEKQPGSEWIWDTEHKRYGRWDGKKWMWSSK